MRLANHPLANRPTLIHLSLEDVDRRSQAQGARNRASQSHHSGRELRPIRRERKYGVCFWPGPGCSWRGAVQGVYICWLARGPITWPSTPLRFTSLFGFRQGKVGQEYSIEDAQKAARICGINLLSQLREACDGDLDRVEQVSQAAPRAIPFSTAVVSAGVALRDLTYRCT